MTIFYQPDFISSIKDKYILLDSNIFIDSISKPTDYGNFFNEMKRSNVTLVTIDFVKYELLKGAANREKYDERLKLINSIVDTCLPITKKTHQLVDELINEYKIEGTALSVVDLFLGALLYQYGQNLYLLTRDTTDFIQRIFDLAHIINVPNSKGINTYGVYKKKEGIIKVPF